MHKLDEIASPFSLDSWDFCFFFLSGFDSSQGQIIKSPGDPFCSSAANELGKLRSHLADKPILFDKGPKCVCKQGQIVFPSFLLSSWLWLCHQYITRFLVGVLLLFGFSSACQQSLALVSLCLGCSCVQVINMASWPCSRLEISSVGNSKVPAS